MLVEWVTPLSCDIRPVSHGSCESCDPPLMPRDITCKSCGIPRYHAQVMWHSSIIVSEACDTPPVSRDIMCKSCDLPSSTGSWWLSVICMTLTTYTHTFTRWLKSSWRTEYTKCDSRLHNWYSRQSTTLLLEEGKLFRFSPFKLSVLVHVPLCISQNFQDGPRTVKSHVLGEIFREVYIRVLGGEFHCLQCNAFWILSLRTWGRLSNNAPFLSPRTVTDITDTSFVPLVSRGRYIHCERSNNRLLISLPSSFPTAWDGSSETDSDHSRRLPPGPEGHEDRIRLSQMVELPTAVRERPVFFGIKPSFLPLASITTLLLYKTSTRVKVCVRNHMTPAIHVMCKTCAWVKQCTLIGVQDTHHTHTF